MVLKPYLYCNNKKANMQSVNSFINNALSDGLVFDNKFRLSFAIPHLQSILTLPLTLAENNKVSMLATSVNIPTKSINTISVRTYNKYTDMPLYYNKSETIKVTLLLDNKMLVYNSMLGWLNTVVNYKQNIVNYLTDFATDIVIDILGADGSILQSFKATDAYITSLSEIKMSSNNKSTIATVDCEFTYKEITNAN